MLKYENIIKNLTIKQKIALLASCSEAEDEYVSENGIPLLKPIDLWAMNGNEGDGYIFPSAQSLANSWNPKLFGEVAAQLAAKGAEKGGNLFILPNAVGGSSYYSKSISEDPLLSGKLIGGALKGLEGCNMAACMKAPVYSKSEKEVLDVEADPRALYEHCAAAYKTAVKGSKCSAVLVPEEFTKDSYGELNAEMLENVIPEGTAMLCEIKNSDNTVQALNNGKHLLKASPLVIETSLENYEKTYRSMEEGGATMHELNLSVKDGAAISEEMIDEALDRRLEFTFSCATQQKTPAEPIEAVARRAVRESIVLLKNKVLPLQPGVTCSIIGDVVKRDKLHGFEDNGFITELSTRGINCAGYARGYDLDTEISESLIAPAVSLAERSDVVLLFLGIGRDRDRRLYKSHRLLLPANQQALVQALKKTGKKIVAIVCGSRLPNMSFDNNLHASLLIPDRGLGLDAALADVLSGKYSPVGRLAYSAYSDTDDIFHEVQKRKRNGTQKVGTFIGYRYTERNGIKPKYPFGHGICFGSVTYSNLFTTGRGASVLIKNTSDDTVTETVQVYVGKSQSSLIRPQKELKKVFRIEFKPHESKRINFELDNLEVYDPINKKFVTETGEYELYVGSSLTDIKLNGNINQAGESITPQKQNASEYLHEVSNIYSGKYTMEARCEPMKTNSKLKYLGIWLLALTFFFDAIYGVCSLMLEFPFMEYGLIFIVVNAILIILGIILIAVHKGRVNKLQAAQSKKEEELSKDLFADVEQVNVKSLEALFADEFDVYEAAANKEKVEDEDIDAVYTYMDVETDLVSTVTAFEKFSEERGLKVTPAFARDIVSAFLTSKLIIFRNPNGVDFARMMGIVSGFFGAENMIGSAVGFDWVTDDLLAQKSVSGYAETAIGQAFKQAAYGKSKKGFFLSVRDVKSADAAKFLMPYVHYISNPVKQAKVTSVNGEVYDVPANFWMILTPATGECVDDLPAFIANLAVTVELDAIQCEVVAERTPYKPLSVSEYDALLYRAKKNVVVSESVWKKIDTLEELVNEHVPYHIGNKICLQLEAYLAVNITCGGGVEDAVDSILAHKIMPAILSITKGNASMADVDILHTLESLFGEENISKTRRLLKDTGKSTVTEEVAITEDEVKAEFVTEVAPEVVPEVEAEPVVEPEEEVTEVVSEVEPVVEAEPVTEPEVEAEPVVEPEEEVTEVVPEVEPEQEVTEVEEEPVTETEPEATEVEVEKVEEKPAEAEKKAEAAPAEEDNFTKLKRLAEEYEQAKAYGFVGTLADYLMLSQSANKENK